MTFPVLIALALTISMAPPARGGVSPEDLCTAKKSKATGRYSRDRLKAFGKDIKKPNVVKLAADLSKAQSKLTKAFTKAELSGTGDGCRVTGDVQSLRDLADAFVGCIVDGDDGGDLIDAADVIFLASDALDGRNNDTQGSTDSQEYLIDELLELGAVGLDEGQTGRDAFKQAFPLGTNILGLIPGQDPDAYVMVGAHYDHIGSCPTAVPADTICNGATDNAAGVAAVLAIAREIAGAPTAPARSVILALWDREEDGLLGSEHYVNNPLVPLVDTIGYVNFDIQGANLLPSLRNFSVAIGAETGGAELRALLDTAVSGEGLGTRPLSYLFGQLRSDYANLVDAGVPTVFFSDSTGGCYHTAQDEVSVVDFDKLEVQTRIALKLTRGLIDTSTPPPFAGPSPGLATFEDATIINDVVNLAIATDLALFSPADQSTLLNVQAQLNAIVADGEANFDGPDVGTLLGGTINVVSLLTQIDCDGFLAP